VLLLDATITGANGLAYIAGATALDSLLGPSSTHLVVLGLFLVACSSILAMIGTRQPIRRGWTMFAVDVNIAWAVGSIATVALGWLELTTTGQVWAILQAGLVAVFAAMQLLLLRRS
ncbi:MAG: hypothetical protein ABIN55_13830, partial [Aeromicrobium sp.]